MFRVTLVAALLAATPALQSPDVGGDEARTSMKKAAAYLEREQHPDGSWGSGAADSVQFLFFSPEAFYDFQFAANALAFKALASLEETPARRAKLDNGLEWLVTTRMPARGNDWDVDCSWSALWGFNALVGAAKDPRFASERWKPRIQARAKELYALLERNQEPLGGWGYYEGPVVSRRPTWSTSFSTACVIPSLLEAKDLGWEIDPKVTARAVEYVRRCRLPSGAYTYDLQPIPWVGGESINEVKGSLGRIQACNWARRRAGDKRITDEEIRKGLEAFFAEHRFLDAARMKPVPHEAWYFNAAYFYFFGHYHAALVINELPVAEREAWHKKLRAELIKVQWQDGSSIDFPNLSSMQIAGTSFSLLALQAGLAPGG
jgi:hypothetical protein